LAVLHLSQIFAISEKDPAFSAVFFPDLAFRSSPHKRRFACGEKNRAECGLRDGGRMACFIASWRLHRPAGRLRDD
jgi:hypothetical protein